jgi:hypothetical protein
MIKKKNIRKDKIMKENDEKNSKRRKSIVKK